MVAVGLELQEQGRCVLVGQGAGHKMACFRKLSDEIRLSSSEYSLCLFSLPIALFP